MKKKDDDLLRLAFGELSAENARAVEARVAGDASARAELDELRDLRAGLQRLPPPPPDTLSADRLRAAILDRELRERRPAPFGWAWVPVMAASFAAVLFISRPTAPKGDVQILSPGPVAMKEAEPKPEARDFLFNTAIPPVVATQKAAPMAVATADSAPRPLARRHRREAPQERTDWSKTVVLNQESPEIASSVAAEPKAPETMPAPTSAIVEGGPYTGGPESIVLVSSKRDLDTGAHAGTETEASNVVVGG